MSIQYFPDETLQQILGSINLYYEPLLFGALFLTCKSFNHNIQKLEVRHSIYLKNIGFGKLNSYNISANDWDMPLKFFGDLLIMISEIQIVDQKLFFALQNGYASLVRCIYQYSPRQFEAFFTPPSDYLLAPELNKAFPKFRDFAVELEDLITDDNDALLDALCEGTNVLTSKAVEWVEIVYSRHKRTPLHIACYLSKEKCVDVLLKHKANIFAVEGKYGQNPLHIACQKHKSFECVKLLVDPSHFSSPEERKKYILINDRDHCSPIFLSSQYCGVMSKTRQYLSNIVEGVEEENAEVKAENS